MIRVPICQTKMITNIGIVRNVFLLAKDKRFLEQIDGCFVEAF
jgi:hypothetical protein